MVPSSRSIQLMTGMAVLAALAESVPKIESSEKPQRGDFTRGVVCGYSPVGSTKRIGRNEPCPCGSGKKFKKCCNR